MGSWLGRSGELFQGAAVLPDCPTRDDCIFLGMGCNSEVCYFTVLVAQWEFPDNALFIIILRPRKGDN